MNPPALKDSGARLFSTVSLRLKNRYLWNDSPQFRRRVRDTVKKDVS
jgi:hypothetical protein